MSFRFRAGAARPLRRGRRPLGAGLLRVAAAAVLVAAAAATVPRNASSGGAAVAPPGAPLLVFAGAGFRLPIEAAGRIFEQRTGVPVETTFAGSGCLLAQAELAGRGDLFIPGELHYLEQAQRRELAGRAVSIAYLRPVVAVPRGNPRGITGLADLALPGLRIGLGDPTSVAVGIAAESWLEAALAEDVRARVHANVRTRAINVNELGSQLALGALDAVIVWDVTVPLFEALEAIVPPSSARHRTIITGGVLKFSRQPETAARFLDFLASDAGAAIFRGYGYEPFPGNAIAAGAAAPAADVAGNAGASAAAPAAAALPGEQ